MRSIRVFSQLCLAVYTLLALRAAWLHLSPSSHLSKLARRQYETKIELAPYRGTIYDRKQNPLAISIRAPSIAMNPRAFHATPQNIRLVSNILNIPKKKVQRISRRKGYFAWVQRKVAHHTASKMKSEKIPGIFEIVEPSRFYPGIGVAPHLIGYVGMDNVGLLGLESSYEKFLRGEPMRILRSRDARGKPIFLSSAFATPEIPGHDINLTIDQVIQDLSQNALRKGVEKAGAKSGFAIVMDPYTGNILALANEPSFDPNKWRNIQWSQTRNHALSDLYEPGSVIKPIVMAQALDQQYVKLDEKVNCHGGHLKLKKGRIHDDHPYDELSAEDILVYSSNIGIYQIAKRMGQNKVRTGLAAFGLKGYSQVGLPEEAKGRIPNLPWSDLRLANIAFGQGLSVVGLEIAAAYSVIANGGTMVSPRIIHSIVDPQGISKLNPPEKLSTNIISPSTALKIRETLHQVVIRGTGKNAQTASYEVAGKTGTSEKFDRLTKKYSENLRIASFAGFAPALDPHIVVYVVIDEPSQKPYYGGLWAAPIFSEIVEESLKYLNVATQKDIQA